MPLFGLLGRRDSVARGSGNVNNANQNNNGEEPILQPPIPEHDSNAQVQVETPGVDQHVHEAIKQSPTEPFKVLFVPHSDPARKNSAHAFDAVEKPFGDGIVIKLGRPVKPKSGENGGQNGDDVEGGEQFNNEPKTIMGKNGKVIEMVWFKSKVVSRIHAEIWYKDGQLYVKDTGSSSGTFLNKLRLSPTGKESRPYPLKSGDIIQLGMDYQGRPEDVFKCVIMKVMLPDGCKSGCTGKSKGHPMRHFQNALRSLLDATNPYAAAPGTKQPANNPKQTVDCCICLSTIIPYQALFISPCSHCYHYKCIQTLLSKGYMFQCPLCRQVANLNASVSMESLDLLDQEDEEEKVEVEDGVVTDKEDSENENDNDNEHPIADETAAIVIAANGDVNEEEEEEEADDEEEDDQPLQNILENVNVGLPPRAPTSPQQNDSLSEGLARLQINTAPSVLVGDADSNNNDNDDDDEYPDSAATKAFSTSKRGSVQNDGASIHVHSSNGSLEQQSSSSQQQQQQQRISQHGKQKQTYKQSFQDVLTEDQMNTLMANLKKAEEGGIFSEEQSRLLEAMLEGKVPSL